METECQFRFCDRVILSEEGEHSHVVSVRDLCTLIVSSVTGGVVWTYLVRQGVVRKIEQLVGLDSFVDVDAKRCRFELDGKWSQQGQSEVGEAAHLEISLEQKGRHVVHSHLSRATSVARPTSSSLSATQSAAVRKLHRPIVQASSKAFLNHPRRFFELLGLLFTVRHLYIGLYSHEVSRLALVAEAEVLTSVAIRFRSLVTVYSIGSIQPFGAGAESIQR